MRVVGFFPFLLPFFRRVFREAILDNRFCAAFSSGGLLSLYTDGVPPLHSGGANGSSSLIIPPPRTTGAVWSDSPARTVVDGLLSCSSPRCLRSRGRAGLYRLGWTRLGRPLDFMLCFSLMNLHNRLRGFRLLDLLNRLNRLLGIALRYPLNGLLDVQPCNQLGCGPSGQSGRVAGVTECQEDSLLSVAGIRIHVDWLTHVRRPSLCWADYPPERWHTQGLAPTTTCRYPAPSRRPKGAYRAYCRDSAQASEP